MMDLMVDRSKANSSSSEAPHGPSSTAHPRTRRLDIDRFGAHPRVSIGASLGSSGLPERLKGKHGQKRLCPIHDPLILAQECAREPIQTEASIINKRDPRAARLLGTLLVCWSRKTAHIRFA